MGEPPASGLVALQISGIGRLSVRLFVKQAPLASRNFVQLALEGLYDGTKVVRTIPHRLAQLGDVKRTVGGGDSAYESGESIWAGKIPPGWGSYDSGCGLPDQGRGGFPNEISPRLRFSRRGLVAMANEGVPCSNRSQFFITLGPCPELNGKYTIFGTLVDDSIFAALKFSDLQPSPEDPEKPLFPPVIERAVVIENPIDDIVPRFSGKNADKSTAIPGAANILRPAVAASREQGRKASLLSFGAAEELSDDEGSEDGPFLQQGKEHKPDIAALRMKSSALFGSRAAVTGRTKKTGDGRKSKSEKRKVDSRYSEITATTTTPLNGAALANGAAERDLPETIDERALPQKRARKKLRSTGSTGISALAERRAQFLANKQPLGPAHDLHAAAAATADESTRTKQRADELDVLARVAAFKATLSHSH